MGKKEERWRSTEVVWAVRGGGSHGRWFTVGRWCGQGYGLGFVEAAAARSFGDTSTYRRFRAAGDRWWRRLSREWSMGGG
jgi:hypothetical protein